MKLSAWNSCVSPASNGWKTVFSELQVVEMQSSVLFAPQLRAATALAVRAHSFDTHLDPSDAARYALTDFRQEPPITVGPDRLIEEALSDMDRLEVHALLVAPSWPEESHVIAGLITASDIARRHNPRRNGCTRVGDAMTAVDELSLVHYDSINHRRRLIFTRCFRTLASLICWWSSIPRATSNSSLAACCPAAPWDGAWIPSRRRYTADSEGRIRVDRLTRVIPRRALKLESLVDDGCRRSRGGR